MAFGDNFRKEVNRIGTTTGLVIESELISCAINDLMNIYPNFITSDAATKEYRTILNNARALNSAISINDQSIKNIFSSNATHAGGLANNPRIFCECSDVSVQSPKYLLKAISSTLDFYDFKQSTLEGENKIIYGTPGCGKSFYIDNNILNGVDDEYFERTTFYSDYSYTDFVGQIMPILKGNSIFYDFVPGPFTLALEKAIKYPDKKIYLIIEEINRGNAANIFGDLFQLLDRKDGVSQYSITNVNIRDYLNKQFNFQYKFNKIKIPSNLYLYATMNTGDQNVFTLDNAFKRRWSLIELFNDWDKHPYKDMKIPSLIKNDRNYTWEQLAKSINEYILSNDQIFNKDDKILGMYFISKDDLLEVNKVDAYNESELKDKVKLFSNKILEYLWNDVDKYHRDMFKKINSLHDLILKYEEDGLAVFNEGIIK